MKLGVMTVCLSSLSLDEACRSLKEQGVQQVEIGCGGSPGTATRGKWRATPQRRMSLPRPWQSTA